MNIYLQHPMFEKGKIIIKNLCRIGTDTADTAENGLKFAKPNTLTKCVQHVSTSIEPSCWRSRKDSAIFYWSQLQAFLWVHPTGSGLGPGAPRIFKFLSPNQADFVSRCASFIKKRSFHIEKTCSFDPF